MCGPEPGVALQAFWAGQPAKRVDSPSCRDRTGADVGLAKRNRILVVRDARTHLAPRDGYPELVADRRPLGDLDAGPQPSPAAGRAGGWLSGRRGRCGP